MSKRGGLKNKKNFYPNKKKKILRIVEALLPNYRFLKANQLKLLLILVRFFREESRHHPNSQRLTTNLWIEG
jgi:hypothetical protein